MQVYREHRIAQIQALKAAGESPYPHKFHVDLSLTDYIEKYSHLEDGARLEDTLVNISGECIQAVGSLYIVVARASFLFGLHFLLEEQEAFEKVFMPMCLGTHFVVKKESFNAFVQVGIVE